MLWKIEWLSKKEIKKRFPRIPREEEMKRDQFICEEVLHKCWHEWDGPQRPVCWKCGKFVLANPDYSEEPADILELQRFTMGAEWWGAFTDYAYDCWYGSGYGGGYRLVAEYRGWKG